MEQVQKLEAQLSDSVLGFKTSGFYKQVPSFYGESEDEKVEVEHKPAAKTVKPLVGVGKSLAGLPQLNSSLYGFQQPVHEQEAQT